jgi:polyadenylation factor subunit 2
MGSLPMPPNMPQLQHPSHSPMVPHQHLPRPPPQMPLGMPGSLPVPTSHPMSIPGPMVCVQRSLSF